jgi:DNA polymerase III epsilon subunit-like protein
MFNFPKDLLIIDVETSGTDENASIIQLGAVIFDKSGKLCNTEFNKYIIPYTLEWSEDAYKVHKIERSFLVKNGMILEDALHAFEEWASCHGSWDLKKKYWLAQWSCGFDTNMLQNAYAIAKREYPFHYRAIDVASIVRFELANRGRLKVKCGEKKCAEALDIEIVETKLHDALYDAKLSGQMLEKLARRK